MLQKSRSQQFLMYNLQTDLKVAWEKSQCDSALQKGSQEKNSPQRQIEKGHYRKEPIRQFVPELLPNPDLA